MLSGAAKDEVLAAQSKHPYNNSESKQPPPKCDGDHIRRRIKFLRLPHMLDRRYYCVYILASLSGTLYIGFSGNLHKRIFQHKFHHFEGFTDRYEAVRLLYWESYDDVHKALAREKQLKRWSRKKDRALRAPQSAMERPGRRMVSVDATNEECTTQAARQR
jgi:putative endonuclease